MLAIRPFRKMCLVLDAHNITIDNALIGKSVLERLAAYSIRSADYVIVSNTILACEVEKLGGRPLVLADKLPVMHSGSIPDSFAAMKRPHILFVSTYASDEPIELFLEAVVRLEREFTLFVTGKRSKARGLDEKWSSEKIVFTDFLPVVEYDSLLASVDLVVDLSTLANCLVCGAYEAVSAQVPFILSDNEASRACFPKGGLYATNSIEGLEQALNQYFVKAEILRHEVAEMKAEFEARWLREFQSICNTLSKEPS